MTKLSSSLHISLPYCHINAFGDGPFKGNQAAVMPLETWLDDDILQSIGEENNFAETAFFIPDSSAAADYELRWFTPSIEIKLCGHATLASGYYILEQNRDKERITFRTRDAGILTVKRTDNGYAVGLPSYRPSPAPMPDWANALDKGGLMPVQHHYHEGHYHIFLFENADQIRALQPDFSSLIESRQDDQFICTAPNNNPKITGDTDVISRVFVPGAGVNEDSVTGSAHAVLTPFWTDKLGRDHFTAYQASNRGGYLNCSFESDKLVGKDGDTVWLGGQCAKVVEGIFTL